MDIKSGKKLKLEEPSDTAAKVENYLQIYNQYKNETCKSLELYGDEHRLKDNPTKESYEKSTEQVFMKEKLLAVRFDHCYSNNIRPLASV